MTVEYLDLADYIAIASEITGLDEATVMKGRQSGSCRLGATRARGGVRRDRVLPRFVRKAAVLIVRPAKNHPLPDGNKRVCWVALRVFIEINGWSWSTYPSVVDAESRACTRVAG